MLGLPPPNAEGWVLVMALGVFVFLYFRRRRHRNGDPRRR